MNKILKLIILTLFVTLGCTGCIGYMNEKEIECTVEEKWIKRPSGEEDELYLVNCGGTIYKIEDLFFKGKFNSADIYGNLKVGKKYKLIVTGYRLQFFSEYQNINDYKLIEE